MTFIVLDSLSIIADNSVVEERGVRFSAPCLVVKYFPIAHTVLWCFVQTTYKMAHLLVSAWLFKVIATFKCMLVGYCFPVLSIYFGRPRYSQRINTALNVWAKWGSDQLWMEWAGEMGVAVCMQITLNKSGNIAMISDNKVTL